MMNGTNMTHYMGLLPVNQPWNLLLFVAAPVILAETPAITALFILFQPNPPSCVRALPEPPRWSGRWPAHGRHRHPPAAQRPNPGPQGPAVATDIAEWTCPMHS